jgi:hypothetical protein
MEEWKDIPGFENYQASNLGAIRNQNGHIMTPIVTEKGYLIVNLRDKDNSKLKIKRRVSRLVAFTFISNSENKAEIDHINRNPWDNRVENLRWATRTENLLNRKKYKT